MVYCGLFPTVGHEFERLRDALGKLQLNDAALHYEPDVSVTFPTSPCLQPCSSIVLLFVTAQ